MHHIQLYYQVPETLEICELYKNGNNPWVQGVRHPAGAQATSIAAATTGEGTQVWYQTQDTKFVQWLFEAGEEWKKGTVIRNPTCYRSLLTMSRQVTLSLTSSIVRAPPSRLLAGSACLPSRKTINSHLRSTDTRGGSRRRYLLTRFLLRRPPG